MVITGMVAGAIIGSISSKIGIGKQNKSTLNAFKKQMKYVMQNYNYAQASYDKQERNMYDEAMTELFAMSVNTLQNDGSVYAAMAETGVEGRNTEKLGQSMRAQEGLASTAVKEAHERSVWQVRSAKDALYVQTVAEVDQARDQVSSNLIGGARAFGMILQGAATGAVMGAATAGMASAAGGALGGAAGGGLTASGAGAAGLTAGGATLGGTAGATGFGLTAGGATLGGTAGATMGTGVQTALGASAVGSSVLPNYGAAVTSAQYAQMTGTTGTMSNFMGAFSNNYELLKPQLTAIQQAANGVYKVGSYFNQTSSRRRTLGYYNYAY